MTAYHILPMVQMDSIGPAGKKGAITSPVYCGMTPSSAGTEPGTHDAEMKPNKPIIASRPLLTSAMSFFSFCSAVSDLVKPNGSQG